MIKDLRPPKKDIRGKWKGTPWNNESKRQQMCDCRRKRFRKGMAISAIFHRAGAPST
jgi:hypothetical protein